MNFSIKPSTSCSYISSKMTKSSSFLKKIVTNKSSIKLTSSQMEAALPFVAQESTKTKSKTLSRFFKKISNKSLTTSNESKTQYKLTFIPIIKEEETITKTQTEVTEIVWYDSETTSTTTTTTENSTIETAQRIYNQDTTVYNSLDKIVEWIGNGKESSNTILQSYMSLFDFKDFKLEQAFRTLCSKLYLKGETQQIDRILLQFSTRYFECNPHTIFGSVDVVHAIVYSLLLLNTDLHVAQGDYKKMSQSAFVKNTINAISIHTPADFSSSPSVQSFDWTPLQRVPSNTSDVSSRSSSYTRSFDSGVPRTWSFISSESKTWELQIKNMLKQMYSQVRHSQITDPSTPLNPLSRNSSRVGTFRRSVDSIIKKKSVHDEDTNTIKSVKSFVSCQQKEVTSTYINGTPYYKEGPVVVKHLLESKDLKAKHRDWKECFVVIERSQLNIYKRTIADDGSFAQLTGSIDLKHTLACVLPSGYSRQRQYAFTLQQSNGAVHVFQTESSEHVEEWVSTCNYWAARESKEPLVGGISSMEYGWGHCLENQSSATIHEWNSPSSPIISSVLEESEQLEVFIKHIDELTSQLDQHHDIKSKMVSHFTGSKFNTRAMANWKNKLHYLLSEIIKYQNYCNSIEKSLSLHATIMA